MSSLKAPTTASELVGAYASLSRDEKFEVTGVNGETVDVANEYVAGVHTVTIDGVVTRALWIFHPHTQMAHIEALPSPGEGPVNTDLSSTDLKAWAATELSPAQAEGVAPSVALGLLKAFVGGFNRRKWGAGAGSASEQGVRAPRSLYFEGGQAQTLGPAVRAFLVRAGMPEAQVPIRAQPAQEADAALAATAWRQFVLAMQAAPQGSHELRSTASVPAAQSLAQPVEGRLDGREDEDGVGLGVGEVPRSSPWLYRLLETLARRWR